MAHQANSRKTKNAPVSRSEWDVPEAMLRARREYLAKHAAKRT